MKISPTKDLSSYALQTLIQLMLAQAQECVWQKAAIDRLRDGTIARLASKIADYYDCAHESATNSSIQEVYPLSWLSHLQIKALHFHAAAQFRKSCECISQNKYGEEVARLQIANGHVKRACDMLKGLGDHNRVSGAVVSDLKSLAHIIHINLARAEKDNNVIYLEVIPPFSSLPTIQKTEMVKALAPTEVVDPVSLMMSNTNHRMDGMPHPVIGLPLFQKLVPFAVHQAASVYADRKERLLKEDILEKLEELQEVCHGTLQSIDVFSLLQPKSGLPDALLKQAGEVRSSGGSQALYEMWDRMQQASLKNLEILEEAFNALDDEHETDELQRNLYRERWVRPESHVLTSQWVDHGQRHRMTLLSAQKADQTVRAKLNAWAKIIDVLVLKEEELKSSVLDAYEAEDALEPSPTKIALDALEQLIRDIETLQKEQRSVMEQAKRTFNADDISPLLLKKAAQLTAKSPTAKIEPAEFENLFLNELRKYDSYLMTVDEQEERQRRLLQKTVEAHQNYILTKQNDTYTSKLDKAIQNLSQAYHQHKEIKSNLIEGHKFYSDHAKGLMSFRNTCYEYCIRRRSESEKIVEKLSAGMNRMSLKQHYPSSTGETRHSMPSEQQEKGTRM
ncbi:BRO1-like domain-containing protein [Spinellus fusiger]|nr:BRO1-like domain-containing protein [Spinellus fusiger]